MHKASWPHGLVHGLEFVAGQGVSHGGGRALSKVLQGRSEACLQS